MKTSSPVIKEIIGIIAVYLGSLFIISSSFFRGYVIGGRDHTESDLIFSAILALILTITYLFFKRKYAKLKIQKRDY